MINLINYLVILCSTASFFYILISMISQITQKYFSSKWHYNILKLNIVLFLLPVYMLLKGAISIFSIPTFKMTHTIELLTDKVSSAMNNIQINETANIATHNGANTLSQVIVFIWLIGAFVSLLSNLYCGLRFKRDMAKSEEITDNNIYMIFDDCKERLKINKNIKLTKNKCIYSPILVGLISPQIILSSSCIHKEHLEYIFIHELTHYKRKDLWWKTAMIIVSIVYWFNPIVYRLNTRFEKEIEFSCDENVVSSLSTVDRKKYGLAILETINSKNENNKTYGVCLSTPKQKLERRLTKMLNFKSMKKSTKIGSTTLALTLLSTALIPAFANAQDLKPIDEVIENWGTESKADYPSDAVATYYLKDNEETGKEDLLNSSLDNIDEWIAKIENGEIKPNSFEHIQEPEAVTNNQTIDAQIVAVTSHYLDDDGKEVRAENINE